MNSVRRKIIVSFLVIIAVSVLIPLLYFRLELRQDLEESATQNALFQARSLGYIVENTAGEGVPEDVASLLRSNNERLTVLDASGRVVYDSALDDESALDNHLDRPEIREALKSGKGVSIRRSNTVDEYLIYVAVPLESGGALRLAAPYADLDSLLYKRLHAFLLVSAAAVFLATAIAFLFTARMRRSLEGMISVVESIASGDHSRRLHQIPGKEFAPLAEAVNSLAGDIERQLRRVDDRSRQLEAILRTVPDGVLVLDAQGRIRSHNPALERLFPEFSGADGRHLPEVLAIYSLEDSLKSLLAADIEGKNAEELSRTVELEYPLGRFLLVHMARPAEGQPLRPGSRTTSSSLGAVLVFSDITRIMRLERTRRDFVANVSHELRTPLTAIQGYAETLSSLLEDAQGNPADQQKFAGIIERQASRLGRLVEDLLSLARLEDGNGPQAGASCEAVKVVTDAVQLFEQSAAHKNVSINILTAGPQMTKIACDHLFQVLENLLDNALRVSPESGTIDLIIKKEGKDSVFSVADQGPGITPADQERIFERFYKSSGQTKSSSQQGNASTGLGLAICKHIIELYGGSISVESPAPGYVTAFTFRLEAL